MNKLELVYVGDKKGVEIPHHRKIFKFENRRPRFVPDDLAIRLLRQETFILATDMGKPLIERLPQGGTVLCRRWGAIGDLLMLRAAASAFMREHPGYDLQLRCEERYEHLFAGDPLWAVRRRGGARTADDVLWGAESRALPQPDLSFSFDQVAEQDHRGVQEHRVDLFARAMVNRKLDIRPEDWSLPTPDPAKGYVAKWLATNRLERGTRARPMVALQLHGSGRMKSLPEDQVRQLAAELARDASVVLIEYDERKTWEAPGIHRMPGRDALHSIELLRHVDLCVCFDSGVLWMAHVASAPTLCIMGPTRPEQRLTYHPLYPGRVRAVLLNDTIELEKGKPGCPACFEAADRCRQRYACMQEHPRAVRLVADAAAEMLGIRVPLPVAIAAS